MVIMLEIIQNLWNSKRRQQLSDPRNIGLYIFALVVLAITWSGVKTVQNNYELQKQISALQQGNTVLQLQNENTKLQNQYYKTDQYLELTARQNFGLAAPGEQVLLIPKNVAMKYVDPSLAPQNQTITTNSGASGHSKNLEDWRDFLLGRKLFSD